MKNQNTRDENLIDLLQILANVHQWEVLNSKLMQTVAGRQLYFGLIRNLVQSDEKGLTIDSLKDIYYDKGINVTERGVRLMLRNFEADGILVLERAVKDRRSRKIYLTPKFEQLIRSHSLAIKKEFESKFLVIKK